MFLARAFNGVRTRLAKLSRKRHITEVDDTFANPDCKDDASFTTANSAISIPDRPSFEGPTLDGDSSDSDSKTEDEAEDMDGREDLEVMEEKTLAVIPRKPKSRIHKVRTIDVVRIPEDGKASSERVIPPGYVMMATDPLPTLDPPAFKSRPIRIPRPPSARAAANRIAKEAERLTLQSNRPTFRYSTSDPSTVTSDLPTTKNSLSNNSTSGVLIPEDVLPEAVHASGVQDGSDVEVVLDIVDAPDIAGTTKQPHAKRRKLR
ncbi:hypothetical protein HK097_006178 [Rhizophlyctis rosea]|uniref:Uncharacterized protein n=1 Tax=Rhizophlyctis rosea TaxID=64517 RepID=A0AAD5X4R9_9FUNG|nr:hypothetical protein HK097_006178 [Rhizophlyctis rosea]